MKKTSDSLTGKGVIPELRTYLCAYVAGVDWYMLLAEGDREWAEIVQAARLPCFPHGDGS